MEYAKLIHLVDGDRGKLFSLEGKGPIFAQSFGEPKIIEWYSNSRNWPRSEEIEENVRKYLNKQTDFSESINSFVASKGAYSHGERVGIVVQYSLVSTNDYWDFIK